MSGPGRGFKMASIIIPLHNNPLSHPFFSWALTYTWCPCAHIFKRPQRPRLSLPLDLLTSPSSSSSHIQPIHRELIHLKLALFGANPVGLPAIIDAGADGKRKLWNVSKHINSLASNSVLYITSPPFRASY